MKKQYLLKIIPIVPSSKRLTKSLPLSFSTKRKKFGYSTFGLDFFEDRTKLKILSKDKSPLPIFLFFLQRMSVFEPYPMRDTVQHFCEKHLDKIKLYMESLMVRIPLPVKCTIEERKGRKFAKLHYACQGRTGEYCLYKTSFYTMKTRNPRPWIHLMFLALQVLFKVHVQRSCKS